jgi:hypothetical protein
VDDPLDAESGEEYLPFREVHAQVREGVFAGSALPLRSS